MGVVAGLALAACQHPVVRRLEGTWYGDGVENVDREQLAEASGWAKGTAMEFAGSRVKLKIPAHAPRTAQYRVAKVDGARVVLALRECRDCDPEPPRLVLDRDYLLRWDIGEHRYVVLRRLATRLPVEF